MGFNPRVAWILVSRWRQSSARWCILLAGSHYDIPCCASLWEHWRHEKEFLDLLELIANDVFQQTQNVTVNGLSEFDDSLYHYRDSSSGECWNQLAFKACEQTKKYSHS
jgi:hypothetical protein